MAIADSPRKLKVVIDTNVFVSGLHYGGRPRQVLDLLWQGEIEVYISPFILAELARVLEARLRWSSQHVEEVIEAIQASAREIEPQIRLSRIQEKEDDNRILECAVAGQADYLVTGDSKHILPLKEFQGVKIVSTAEFLRIVR